MMWVTLVFVILAEVLGTTAMKYSDGFSRLWPSVGTAAGYLVAFALLAQTLKSMSIGAGYAVWAGAGTAAIGMVFLGEAASATKIIGIVLVIPGVAVLNMGGAH